MPLCFPPAGFLGRRAGVAHASLLSPNVFFQRTFKRLTLIPAEVLGVHHLQFKNRKAKCGKHRG